MRDWIDGHAVWLLSMSFLGLSVADRRNGMQQSIGWACRQPDINVIDTSAGTDMV